MVEGKNGRRERDRGLQRQYTLQRYAPKWLTSSSLAPPLKFPPPPKTVPPSGKQPFQHMNLWVTFHIQTVKYDLLYLSESNPRKVVLLSMTVRRLTVFTDMLKFSLCLGGVSADCKNLGYTLLCLIRDFISSSFLWL
jgi:hypothetical protein